MSTIQSEILRCRFVMRLTLSTRSSSLSPSVATAGRRTQAAGSHDVAVARRTRRAFPLPPWAAGLALILGAGQALAATYTVTMPSTDIAGACTAVVAGASTCTSLRAAITAANLTTTVDDTIAFSAGGSIAIASALPLITDTTTVNGSSITLNGGGGAYSAIQFSGAGAINSQLQSISIANFNQSAVTIGNAPNVVLNNNTISMSSDSSDAIRCFNSDNCSITGNNISNGFYGISVFNGTAIAGYNATVTGNIITGTNYGVGVASVGNVTVGNNTITSTNFAGIRLVPQFNLSNTDNNSITNNSLTGGAGAGIVFQGFGGMVGLSTLSNNLIQGNTITGNSGAGISFQSSPGVLAIDANTITGNTVTGNGGDGVEISGANAANNAIYANLNISANAGLGIDLNADGVTLNDAGDGDAGPNGLQNFPVVTSIAGNTVGFTLDTSANASGYRIDFYNNPGGLDPTGYGEGQIWLGSCIVASPSAVTPSTCTIAGVSTATLRMTATRCLTGACTSGATSEFNTIVPTVTLTKGLSGNRLSDSDQFTVQIKNGASVLTTPGNDTSAGNGSSVTAGSGTTGATAVAIGTAYTLTEIAAGTANLADYAQSIACTNANTGSTTTLPSGSAQPFTVNPTSAADNISCTLTNASLSRVTVTKVSNGGTGTFAFSGSNGVANHSIVTASPGLGVAGATQTLTTAGAATTITEAAPPAGFVLSAISCTGLGAGGTATPTINGASGGNIVLDAAATAAGSNIACTFTNTKLATLRIQKTRIGTVGGPVVFNFSGDGPGTGLPNDDSFFFSLSTTSSQTHDYGTVNSTPSPGTSALNNLVPGTYTVGESFTDGNNNDFELTNVSCINQAGGITGSTVTPTYGANGGSAAINLVAGANYLCTFINTRDPHIVLTKEVQGAGATFGYSITATGNGSITPAAPALSPVSNSTASVDVDVSVQNNNSRDVTITENAPPAGYVLVSVSCTKIRTAANGSMTSTTYTGNIATRAVTILDFTPDDTGSCNFVNAQQSTVTIRKLSTGGTGTFAFTGGTNGLPASLSLNTATANPQTSAVFALGTPGQPASLTETVPAGWTLTGVACVDASNNGVPVTLTGSTLTIPGGSTGGGEALTCTFSNSKAPRLRLQKQLPLGRFTSTDQFTLNIGSSAVTTTGTTNAPTETATVDPAAIGTSYTFAEAAAAGADLANYAVTYACSNALGGGQAPSGSVGSFSLTPVAGDDLLCTFVNTRNPIADLSITKTNTPGSGPSDLANDSLSRGASTTYTIVVTNNGPDGVTGANLRDLASDRSNLDCTAPATCSGTACPSGTLTPAQLDAGVVLGAMAMGSTVTVALTCVVQ